ncbi:ricin-type beta-trefoil lectin domain protein [Dactylosporangium darangshiense]|uniref:Ricin B lectin domain-containing protein n=1 Tax=Dactylosporangium darangshiense TaxID=579108 RepID=A0ABP8DT31_9ACTN
MTHPDETEPGTAGSEIDDEPLLVRPYVRLRQRTEHPADEVRGGPSPSAGRPEQHGRPAAAPNRTGATRAGRRIGSTLTRHVHRRRRRVLTVGLGTLILLLGTTALVLVVGGQPPAPAANADGVAAPKDRHLTTGAVQAPPPSPASSTPSRAGAPSTAGAPAPSGPPAGSTAPPQPSDSTQPSDAPALDEQPAPLQPPPAANRTGRITGVSGLCLDGAAGPQADRARRWECNGSSGQTWTVARDGTVQTMGRCLQATGGQVALQACDGGPGQQWRSGSADSLINPASGLCLSGPDDDPGSRGPQRVAACNRSDAQRWTLP